MAKPSPFDFVNSINQNKKDLIREEGRSEKEYNAFLINRALSYFSDTVIFANEMNRYSTLDNLLQYDFLINIVKPKKRFSKWAKPNNETIDLVRQYYGYNSIEKAKQALSILTEDQINIIREKLEQGG